MARYTFGEDDAAGRRLALVAEAYEPTSGSFLERDAPSRPPRVLDLGCGPGFSTQLIARVCRPHELVGLDSSPELLASARRRVPGASFVEHDVTLTPLPRAPADLLYARLLLAHLAEPVSIVARWREQLAPGGVILVEALESVEAPPGPLRDYEEVSAAIVRRGGGVMYAGPLLAEFGGRRVPVTVAASVAATIYLFNVRRWLADRPPGISEDRLRELERGLARLTDGSERRSVSWIVRQVSVRA